MGYIALLCRLSLLLLLLLLRFPTIFNQYLMPWFVLYFLPLPPLHLPLPCPFPFSFYWFIWFVGLRPSNTIVWSMVPYYFLYCAVSFVNALELCFFFYALSFIYLYSEVVDLVPSIADTLYIYIYSIVAWPLATPSGRGGGTCA